MYHEIDEDEWIQYKWGINRPYWEKLKQIIMRRSNYTCEYHGCDCNYKLEMHHIIYPYSPYHLNDNPNNVKLLCRYHHELKHGNKDDFYLKECYYHDNYDSKYKNGFIDMTEDEYISYIDKRIIRLKKEVDKNNLPSWYKKL